ncbi:MAG: hypothetical protein ACQERJ_07370 [Bacillota bacterium]
MIKQKIKAWWPSIALAILILLIPKIFGFVVSVGTHDIEDVRNKMKNYLQKKYGEEFVVDRIGTRSSRGQEFYQARIYPKSILGTNKEGDSYYYASATADKLPLGRLGGVGDSYPLVNLKLDIEDYLTPKAKNIFGERILMKIEAHYKRREPGNKTYWGYKVKSFKKARELIAEDRKNRIIELELNLYIFDRIEDEEEKEERRKDIFQFVQYLKEEGLFEYLELRVKFIDERVLANSYYKFKRKIYNTRLVEKKIKEEIIELPPLELRKYMSRKLETELKRMNNKELLRNMNKIRKSYLTFDGIGEYDEQYFAWISSINMLKIDTTIFFEEYKKENNLKRHKYNQVTDIKLKKDPKYIYINNSN